MQDPYRNLTTAQQAVTPLARVEAGTYQMVPYDEATNTGLYEDGHRLLMDAMLADMAALVEAILSQVALVASAANQQQAWQLETAAISRLGSSQIAVTGYRANIYTVGRAVQLVQTANASGRVSAVSYNSGTGLTTITLTGCTVDTGLTQLWFGQDPANAPAMAPCSAASAGAVGGVPAPAAGDQTKYLRADGTWASGGMPPIGTQMFL